MGRPINNIRKEGIRVKINHEGFKKLIALGSSIINKMTGNANFGTPAPALVGVQTAIDNLKAAAAFMGQKRNRGSKAEREQAKQAGYALRNLLTAELKYVVETALVASPNDAPLFATILVSSGFAMSDVRSLNPRAQIATFVQQSNSKLHPGTESRLKWKRPLGLIKGAKVAGYNIYIGGTIFATTTKTNVIIPPQNQVNTDVMIVPFNSKGSGAAFFATIKGLS